MKKMRLLCLMAIYSIWFTAPIMAMTMEAPQSNREAHGPEVPGYEERSSEELGSRERPQEAESKGGLLGDRLSLKVGYKVWVAKWQTTASPTSFTSSDTGSGGLQQITSHDSIMSGPSGSVRLALRDSPWFNSLVGSFTLLNGGFDFQETGSVEEFGIRSRSKQDGTRKDYTATIGFSIWESIGVFAGYYWSEQHFTITGTSTGGTLGNNTILTSRTNGHRELQGPILGLYGSAPIGERVSFYGNIAYAMLNFRTDQGRTSGSPFQPGSVGLNTDAVQGWAAEVGTSIRGPKIWKIGTDLQIGFRGQMILKSFGQNAPSSGRLSDTLGNDVTWGPTFSINAIF